MHVNPFLLCSVSASVKAVARAGADLINCVRSCTTIFKGFQLVIVKVIVKVNSNGNRRNSNSSSRSKSLVGVTVKVTVII